MHARDDLNALFAHARRHVFRLTQPNYTGTEIPAVGTKLWTMKAL